MTAGRPPRGFAAACYAIGVIGVAGLGVTVYQAVHPPGRGSAPRAAGPVPSAHRSAAPSSSAGVPSSGPHASASSAPAGVVPAVVGRPSSSAAGTVASSPAAPTGTPTPTPRSPSPSGPPHPPSGALYAAAAVVVPVRSGTPLAVRAVLVVPTAPPWPPTLAALVLAP